MEILGGAGLAGGAYLLGQHPGKTKRTKMAAPAGIDTSKPHLNLICHGMMLIWYPLPFGSGPGPDYFNILLPNPTMMGMQVHMIAMSQYRGGYANQLTSQGQYELTWGNARTDFIRSRSHFCRQGPPSGDDRALLYDANYRLTPKNGFQSPSPSDPIWYGIQIPYPTMVFPYLPAHFQSGKPGYAQAGSAADLHVDPTTMSGINVFYYEGVTGQIMLNLLQGGTPKQSPIGPAFDANGPGHWNIHLYSQPATWKDYNSPMSHISLFNNMMTYSMMGGPAKNLDLAPQKLQTHDADESWPIDDDLDAQDEWDLAQIFDGPKPSTHNADPVECLQGWGT
jgi:hypothetical protein